MSVPLILLAVLLKLQWDIRRPHRQVAAMIRAEEGVVTLAPARRAGLPDRREKAFLEPYSNGLTEFGARQMIEDCRFFQDAVVILLPKSVSTNLMHWTVSSYPSLLGAAASGLIVFDPPFDAAGAAQYLTNPTNPGADVMVRLGPAAPKAMRITDLPDSYEIDLGRRRIEKINSASRTTEEQLHIGFDWTYEARDLAEAGPEGGVKMGGAALRLNRKGLPPGWVLEKVWSNHRGGNTIVCGN